MAEEYKLIKGFQDYSVSNLGNVRNDKTGKVFKQSNTLGYKRVKLQDKKSYKVHILVAHAFILNPDNKRFVDHIDNDRANNKVSNLRWATSGENGCNLSIGIRNTSGFKGIHWNDKRQNWKAQIDYKGKRMHLGYFKDKEDAIKIRQLKANELFGEFVNKSEKIIN
jgi:hypothetical protein